MLSTELKGYEGYVCIGHYEMDVTLIVRPHEEKIYEADKGEPGSELTNPSIPTIYHWIVLTLRVQERALAPNLTIRP
jgi:hypothetical protein